MARPHERVHIVTVHHNNPLWIDVQLRQIKEHISAESILWGSLQGVAQEHCAKFDQVVPSLGRHEGKLNLLAAEAAEAGDPQDLLMFLDGDAFPIADPLPKCRDLLKTASLVAVRRDENLGDPQPHPCFAMTDLGTWKEVGGDWSMGYPWVNTKGEDVTDVGGNLLRALELSGREWAPLTRTNQLGSHPLWFGVYGGIVYHHGAGFRPVLSRGDSASLPFAKQWSRGDVLRRRLHRGGRRVQSWRGARLSRVMYDKVASETGYAEQFAGQ